MEDKKMISEYIKNDVLDMEEIMRDFTNYIHKIIGNMSNQLKEEDLEEIISDVYMALWKNQKRLDREKVLSSYIAGITKNLVKKRFRKILKNENIDDYEEKLVISENLDLRLEIEEENNNLIKELHKLKKEDQEIFILFYYELKKIKEIAVMLDISEDKVKSRLSRIRKKLNKIMKNEEV